MCVRPRVAASLQRWRAMVAEGVRPWMAAVAVVVAFAVLVARPHAAEACGCLSPPAVTEGEFAVNQRAEQIIFEVEPGWVTAHVLIKYAGNPASFAWIVPVPEVPELAISPTAAFGLLDKLTAPNLNVSVENLCPTSAWSCRYHDQPSCARDVFGANEDGAGGTSLVDAGASGDGAPPVTVISEQVVGDYQTVTFRANEAAAATQWLRDNGFIVNQTTSIYMEPYVQANMVFVAAKLVAGAGIDGIKPLKMRYRAAFPMIPLVLTAVAAEPHLTVSAFVYANEAFRPMGHPVVSIDPNRLARDNDGRLNYPMVLARTVDEAGGDGFVIEYRGNTVQADLNQNSPCCSAGYDRCGVGGDNQCQCPTAEFDRQDCEAAAPDLIAGADLLDQLATKHTTLTRITTRVSPEEMLWDPTFEADFGATRPGRMTVTGTQPSLSACEGAVIDKDSYAVVEGLQGCAALYCGLGGECVTTAAGAGCACGGGTVAQRFIDLDGKPSVTCVPATPTCDLRANGEQLPNACAGVSCGSGQCIDRNGVAVCSCAPNAAAIAGTGTAPRCEQIADRSSTPGAADFSEPLRDFDVCAPPPPSCGENGWLVRTGSDRPGVACGGTEPAVRLTWPGPAPTCNDAILFGCGGCSQSAAPAVPALAGAWIVGLLLMRRRRRPGTR